MKIRTDFVTNSSSSSFVVEIDIRLKNGDHVVFEGNGGSPEVGRVDYFDRNVKVTVSPKELGMAKDLDEMIQLLTDGVLDAGWSDSVKIFEKSMPVMSDWYGKKFNAYNYIRKIKKKIQSMDDIVSITIIGNEENYESYRRSFTYDRETGKYTGIVDGCEFEKDGSSGGDLVFSTEGCEIHYCED